MTYAATPAGSLPRIAIAGLATESSTFTPGSSTLEHFRVSRGDEIFDNYPFFGPDGPVRDRAEWLPVLVGATMPGAPVDPDTYAALKTELLDGLAAAGPLDALYFDIHGAMHVHGMEDAEADLIEAIRAVVGPDVHVSASMDLHGNVTERLVAGCDLITCYRMAPHEDAYETKQRAVENLLAFLAGDRVRPYKAWIPVPVLLPGEQTSTRVEPAKSLYAKVPEVEARPGVLDAAIWIGYVWADEPRSSATVVVTGDDEQAVREGAEFLAAELWRVREEFTFVAPTDQFEGALATAIASGTKPFYLSDSGDNPTAGGAADVPYTLKLILEADLQGKSVIYAPMPDAVAAEKAAAAGVGAEVTVELGAHFDANHGGPLPVTGTVTAVLEGDRRAGLEVVIKVGTVSIIVPRDRKPYHREADFTALGLDARTADIVVIKIGYLQPELYEMSQDWILALTPGGVDQDIHRLGHTRIGRPMFPFDPFDADPDLSARMVPSLS